jgi:hypothetical protein
MSKHTLGPWTIYPETDGTEICAVDYIPGLPIRQIIARPDRSANWIANAHLIAAAPDLLEACQTFAEWLRREDAGFDHKTHNRETPEGEAAWREWFYGNIAIFGLAQEQVRAALAKATGEKL